MTGKISRRTGLPDKRPRTSPATRSSVTPEVPSVADGYDFYVEFEDVIHKGHFLGMWIEVTRHWASHGGEVRTEVADAFFAPGGSHKARPTRQAVDAIGKRGWTVVDRWRWQAVPKPWAYVSKQVRPT